MPSHRLLLLGSSLLVLSLCWPVSANPTTERPPVTGVVTKYVTPVANLSLDKLVGRWYVAELPSFGVPHPNSTEHICLLLDFLYDDNGTLVVEPITMLDGVRSSPHHTFPVSESGVWDSIYSGVSGDAQPSGSGAVMHVDDRFLAVMACKNTSVKECVAFVLVRHLADADRRGDMEELLRQLVSRDINKPDTVMLRLTDPCRSVATAAPDLSAQNGPSTPATE